MVDANESKRYSEPKTFAESLTPSQYQRFMRLSVREQMERERLYYTMRKEGNLDPKWLTSKTPTKAMPVAPRVKERQFISTREGDTIKARKYAYSPNTAAVGIPYDWYAQIELWRRPDYPLDPEKLEEWEREKEQGLEKAREEFASKRKVLPDDYEVAHNRQIKLFTGTTGARVRQLYHSGKVEEVITSIIGHNDWNLLGLYWYRPSSLQEQQARRTKSAAKRRALKAKHAE